MSGTSSNPLATDWFMIITTKIYFCFRVYWKERYISHSTISSQVKSQKSSSIVFLSSSETLLKTLFCILFYHMALLTWHILAKDSVTFFPWHILGWSTENVHSVQQKTLATHTMTTCSVPEHNTRQPLHKPALIGTGKTQDNLPGLSIGIFLCSGA
jgi:hypothetical protein